MYRNASSFDEYSDMTTLRERIEELAFRICSEAQQAKLQESLLQERGVQSVALALEGANGPSNQQPTNKQDSAKCEQKGAREHPTPGEENIGSLHATKHPTNEALELPITLNRLRIGVLTPSNKHGHMKQKR